MRVGVLGPLAIDDQPAGVPRRDRVVLAALAAQAGDVVAAERLADAVWGDQPPASWVKVVQGCILRLRRRLGAEAIETVQHGYRLRLRADDVDALRFDRLLDRGRELLSLGEPDRATHVLGEALALWRGPALGDLEDWDSGRAEARRLQELRLDAEELELEAALQLGRHREQVSVARALVEAAPLRERRWALLARAEYQAGQQAQALRTLHEVRTVLSRELGLDPGPDLVALEAAILRHDPALSRDQVRPAPRPTCPYRGLVAYDVADADDFYGRDREVASCRDRLRKAGAVTVVGPSGSGKSSLVRAGLAAGLRRDGERVVVISPGAHPMDVLSGVSGSGKPPALVVDQCEEAVALCEDPAERASFFAALTRYAERAPLVVAVRADRLGDLSVHAGFARLVERSLFLLSPMTARELRTAIEEPAHGAGLRLEAGLVDLLVREVEGEPGALPLLSHALRATWERREGNTLTVAGYAETGGVRGAVAQTAETVYEQVPAVQRPALRDLLLRLVAPNPEGEPMRSRLPRRLLTGTPHNDRLIETLIAARLLTSDDGVVELAHEALVRAWPRLQGWLDEDAEGQRILRHLVVAADTWNAMGRPDSELYRGARLAAALRWRTGSRPDLTPTEEEFLYDAELLERQEAAAARAAAETQRRASRRFRVVVSGLAFLLLVVTGLGVLARYLWRQVDVLANEAKSAYLAGQVADLTEPSPRLAMLLAATAYRLAPTQEASAAVVRTADYFRGVDQVIEGEFYDAAFSPTDPQRLATVEADRVRLWDLATDQKVDEVAGTGYSDVEFSPDGRSIALARGRSLAMWTPGSQPETVATWKDDGDVYGFKVSPDNEYVAGCATQRSLVAGGGNRVAEGATQAIRVWSLDDEHVDTIPAPAGCMFSFVENGRRIVYVGREGTLHTWDLASRTAVASTRVPAPRHRGGAGELDPIEDFAVAPDGATAVVNFSGSARPVWWDLQSGTRVTAPFSSTPIHPSSFNRTGSLAVTDPPVSLVDMDRKVPLRSVWVRQAGAQATLSADGRRIAEVLDRSIIIMDTSSAPAVPAKAFTAAAREDRLVTASWAGSRPVLSVWNREHLRGTATRLLRDGRRVGALTSDGKLFARLDRRDDVVLWDVQGHKPLRRRLDAYHDPPYALAFDPSGDYLAGLSGLFVTVWNVETGEQLSSWRPPLGGHPEVLLSPGARYVAFLDHSGNDSENAQVWRREPRTQVTGLPSSHVSGMAFSPDGRHLGVSRDGKVEVWDLTRQKMVVSMPGTSPLAFSPNGRLLALRSGSATDLGAGPAEVDVRTLEDGRLAGAIALPQRPRFYQFTPDSSELLIASGGSVSLHAVEPEWAARHLCDVADGRLAEREWARYLDGFDDFDACAPR